MSNKINVIKLFSILSCLLFSFHTTLFAKRNGYHIEVHVTNCKDSAVQLCYSYGKSGMVNIARVQTIPNTNEVHFSFDNDTTIVGGMYMILFKHKPVQFDFLLNNGDSLKLSFDFDKPIVSGFVQGSDEAKSLLEYNQYLMPLFETRMQITKEYSLAKTKKDSAAIIEKERVLNEKIKTYKSNYCQKHPNTFLFKFFKAIDFPEIPKQIKGDKEQEKNYIKEHIWDQFDFKDDRMAYTPIYESKLNTYLAMSTQVPDSINAANDELLKKVQGSKEQYKLVLDWLLKAQESAKMMSSDECYIYLVENYFLKGKAPWANDSTIKSYQAKIGRLSGNSVGVKAPAINIYDINDKPVDLQNIYSKHEYTALIFWSPTCSHCLEEVPKLDSAFASLHRDVAIVGIDAFRETDEWRNVIAKTKFSSPWMHLYDAKQTSNFRTTYDLVKTPAKYLIDRNGIIVGKRYGPQSLVEMFEYLDKLNKEKLLNK